MEQKSEEAKVFMLYCFCIILLILWCALLGRKGEVPHVGPDPGILIAIFRGTSRPGSCDYLIPAS